MSPSCRCIELHQNGGHKRQRRKELPFCALPRASLAMIYFLLLAVVSIDVTIIAVEGSNVNRAGENLRKHKHKHNDKGKDKHDRNLLINGDPVILSEHPFFVRSWPDASSLTTDILCGASLIHSDMILTAAHCQGAFNYGAMAYNPSSGKMNQRRDVDLQIAYPEYYESDSINYDIMVMRLSSPITNIQPVVLNYDPDFPIRRNQIQSSEASFAVLEGLGLGITETGSIADGLEVGLFSALTNDQCYERLGSDTNAVVTEDILCADPSTDESICLGDSGGPLTARVEVEVTPRSGEDVDSNSSPWGDRFVMSVPIQVGIISFGNDCKSDLIPDGFARVSFFADWITEQICKYSNDPPEECSDYFASEDYIAFQAAQDPEGDIPPGRARITLNFQHDFLAEETIFVVRNVKKGSVQYVGPQYVPERGERVSSTFLLDAPGKYAIDIRDSGGNGLNNPDFLHPDYPPGNWSISAEYSHGGRLEGIATGDSQFQFRQTIQFQLPDESEVAPSLIIEDEDEDPEPEPDPGPDPGPDPPVANVTTVDNAINNLSTASSASSSIPTMIRQSFTVLGWVAALYLS